MTDAAPLLDAHNNADLDTIKGWFYASDRRLFAWLLQRQADTGITGDLVELGCYLGKSTVLVGDYLRDGETFTVLDLFESDAGDADNALEMSLSYRTLTEQAFRDNYLQFHPELPVVIKGLSSEIGRHVKPGSARFVHVDASHLYEHVALDVDSAKELLHDQGLVVFDDYRAEHCPGVAAAVWEAVADKGLKVIACTEAKMYATWGDPAPVRDALQQWLTDDPVAYVAPFRLADHTGLRVKAPLLPEQKAHVPTRPAAKPVATAPAQATPSPAAAANAHPTPAARAAGKPAPSTSAEPPRTGRTGARKLAYDLLPPALHRAMSKRLQRRR